MTKITVPKIKEGDFMSKKISVSCPLCGEKLIDVIGCCEGVVMKCSCCGASIKTDVEKSGNMKILLQPAIKKVVWKFFSHIRFTLTQLLKTSIIEMLHLGITP